MYACKDETDATGRVRASTRPVSRVRVCSARVHVIIRHSASALIRSTQERRRVLKIGVSASKRRSGRRGRRALAGEA